MTKQNAGYCFDVPISRSREIFDGGMSTSPRSTTLLDKNADQSRKVRKAVINHIQRPFLNFWKASFSASQSSFCCVGQSNNKKRHHHLSHQVIVKKDMVDT